MAVVTGTSGNDTLNGTSGDDTINGLAGNDVITPGLGYDVVDGGTGTDVLVINYAANTLYGIDTGFYTSDRSSGYIRAYTPSGYYNQVNFSNMERYNITGTGVGDNIYGAANNDTLIGGAGDDYIDIGSGTDSVDGGTGTDTLAFNYSAGTTAINVTASSGTVSSTGAGSVTYSNIEAFNVTATNYNDTLNGAANNDTFNALAGNDIITPGLGYDTVDGGTGTDVLVIDYSANTDYGIETSFNTSDCSSGYIRAYTPSGYYNQVNFSNIERYNITGTGVGDNIYGAANNDTLIGGAGDDVLDIGTGNDSVDGGTGTDTLIFNYSAGTTAINLTLSSGTVSSTGAGSVTYSNIEVFNVTATNYNDTLNGAGNNDTLDGGTGTDVLVIDYSANTDYGIETSFNTSNRSSGYIRAYTPSGYYNQVNFSNMERYNITGTGVGDNIYGAANNDTLIGGAGDDYIDIGSGTDSVDGGTGTDTLAFNYSAGTTAINVTASSGTVSSTGAGSVTYSNIEAFNVTATNYNDTLNGAANNDTFNALAGNDIITPGLGYDTVDGGTGTDVLVIDYSANTDYGIETSFNTSDCSSGYIRAYTPSGYYNQVDFSNIERYNITGTGVGDNIYGAANNDTLIGGAGDDVLDIGTGNDSVDGGTGTDTLIFNYSAGTTAINLTLSSGTVSSTGAGSVTYSNIEVFNVTATNYNDTLNGAGNNDTLDGGTGTDVLVIDYSANTDYGIETSFNTSDCSSGYIRAYTPSGYYNQVNFSNMERYNITGTGVADYIYGAANNDNLIGGAGNDTLDAGAGNDTLNGGAGDDSLIGGDGNDTYIVDTTTDTITETTTGGIDTVQSAVTYTIGDNIENLTLTGTSNINGTGNSLDNIITSNSGINTLSGGNGNDTYIIDSASDIITETATGGIDTVKIGVTYTLSATSNLENLTLTGTSAINGTGNSLNNVITGNDANNILTGDTGADTLIGGRGNDTYVVDNVGDVINEALSTGGTDTVKSSIAWTLTDGSNLENLTLTGSASINGTGNNLNNTITGNTGNNILTGNAGNDILNGGAGADTLIGGTGNDTYVVDNVGDVINEALTTGGTDLVQSSITWALTDGSNLENLTLTGTSIINGTGNSLNNTITGNAANNTLTGSDGNDNLSGLSGIDTLTGGNGDDTLAGGAGNDVLTGNSGNDKFLYNTNATFATSAVGIDTITDFTSGIDKIVLDKTTFKTITSAVGTGFSITSEFATVTNDTDAAISNALIVYNTGNGNLYYNQNKAAAGFGTGAQFDILSGMPIIAATDFLIQA